MKKGGDEGCESEAVGSMYHSLVHSPAAANLLGLEHTFAAAVSSLVAQREQALHDIHER